MQGDDDSLLNLLTRFFAHERAEIADFNKAVKQFATDLPEILKALRDRIAEKHASSRDFAAAVAAFLQHARDAINPAVNEDDVREMLIQHILTEDIFAKVFNDPEFHRKNNVAAELYKLEDKLFDRGEKATLLRALDPYYAGIASTAALIQSHSEKQGFLKALYEDFYKAYNRKAADRLGVVYTPGEIVRFMIRSADWLCEKHFGRNLIDKGVEILDPATGTGTFIVELLEHFRGNHEKLKYKYREELHANEVAILPYYVANLNIEATYQAITGEFAEFENICLADTLDMVEGLGIHSGHQHDMFGAFADENIERIKRQNRRKISVIIGNPPYNANQQNENDNNKNRTYPHIDDRIKRTYIKASTAQKTKLYDMYARFYRWASDRLGDEGVLAFVTNRSFLDSRTFDGFRKLIVNDFQDIWLIDLGGDVRANPKLSGTKHNVFGIQTGVAIAFLVRRKLASPATVHYTRRPEFDTLEDKLSWLHSQELESAGFTMLNPTSDGTWINVGEDGFSSLLPLAPRSVSANFRNSILHATSSGVLTGRDDWAVARNPSDLRTLANEFGSRFNNLADTKEFESQEIKWSRNLKRHAMRGRRFHLHEGAIRKYDFRPFTQRLIYIDPLLADELGRIDEFYPAESTNPACVINFGPRLPFSTLATGHVSSYSFFIADPAHYLARYRYTKSGERVDNITDWALSKFIAHYGKKAGVTKDAIFHYVYAVLHDPVYRETYALNLKREFPRIPLYPEFAKWAAWGEALMAMHIGYEDVEPWAVERVDTPNAKRAEATHPKPVLKSLPEQGLVRVDEDTQIGGIPREAWDYRLGNRSAIDWVLDQHKEKTPRDPTIREKFNTYRFADYKESMVALLAKVVRVSVDTMAITEAMEALDRSGWEE
ncbi:type ISP restriction/modification enzyme [Sphingopyxis sp. NJF-3]